MVVCGGDGVGYGPFPMLYVVRAGSCEIFKVVSWGFYNPSQEGAKFLTVFGVYGRRFGSFLSLSSSRLGASKPQSGANRPVESSGLMRWPGRSLRWPVGIGIGCSRHCHGNNSLWPPQGHTVRLGSRSRAIG